MSSSVELLELRLKYIEDRLFGDKSNLRSTESWTTDNIMEELLKMDSKLKELTTGKERFNNCFQKCLELEKWLDSEYIERMVGSDSSKYEEVIAFEDEIKSEAKMFESMNNLVKNIDSPHIRNYVKLEPKLNQIRSVTLQQSNEFNEVEDKTKHLLLTYNEWLSVIKNQLTVWDQRLSQLEEEKKLLKKKLEFD